MVKRISAHTKYLAKNISLFYRRCWFLGEYMVTYASMCLLEIYLEIMWLIHRNLSWNLVSTNEDPVIVSLTSHAPRFRYLEKTLKCLLLQDYKNFHVVVNLSENDFAKLPLYLKVFEKYNVDFHICSPDLRVFMKLLNSLQRFPDSKIVTADDDIYYGKKWLSTIIRASEHHPNTIIGFRGVIVPDKLSNTSYADWPSPLKSMASRDSILLTGVAGILYPPTIFRNEIDKLIELIALAPTNDDLVYFVAANVLGLDRFCLIGRYSNPRYWNGSQQVALWRINVAERFNDSQFQALQEFKRFYGSGYWQVN